ncbi:MAG: SIR2 family protein [Treponema sp.]|nr:SIR2 family protein [Treponema sp.]
MPRLNKDLLKKLAHGKCFVIVGSGVSIDSGFPSWEQLAKDVLKVIEEKSLMENDDIQRFQKKLISPSVDGLLEIFDLLANKISKKVLVEIIKDIFSSIDVLPNNDIYSMIVKWPINCYLTTNYDSELKSYLLKNNEIFTEYGNKKSEFNLLTANADKNIFKIHGSFDDYENFIITKSDYDKLLSNPNYDYWREKIRAVLHMCTVVLIGYSAKDPDFQEQLKRARELANPQNPIYMFAADLSKDEIVKKSIENNIKVISYKTIDGKHIFLKKLLSQYSRFLPKRNSSLIGKTEESLNETEYNSAVFIYTDMVFHDKKIISKALYNCILNKVAECHTLTEDNLIENFKILKISEDVLSIKQALLDLVQDNYLDLTNEMFSLTQKGQSLLEESSLRVKDFREKFDIYCKLFLEKYDFTADIVDTVIQKLREGLEILFKKRGIEIARKIFIDDTSDIALSFDLEIALESISSGFTDEQYDAFIDLIMEILQNPEKEVRDYLSLICNSYFIYQVLGHDSKAREERLNILKKNKIYVDSNILIPLIAIDCQSYKYANELLQLIKKETDNLFITDRLLKEVIHHAKWAIDNFGQKPISNINSFEVLMEQGGYKENLFIQGALNYAKQNGTIMYTSYFDKCFGENYQENLEYAIKTKIKDLGINIFNFNDFKSDFEKFAELTGDYENYIVRIKENRLKNDSYRSDFQCETEAELLVISKFETISFLTQTSNLKKIDFERKIYHWSPESVYRFLQMNASSADLDSLYNCMVSDMYNNGFTIINAENLREIASPYIHQAELNINDMRKLELKEVSAFLETNLIESNKNDYTLPFYSEQIQYYATNILQKQKENNEKLLESIEREKSNLALNEKERLDYEKMKQKKLQKSRKNTNKRNFKHKTKKKRH